jgi:hypothetical protein
MRNRDKRRLVGRWGSEGRATAAFYARLARLNEFDAADADNQSAQVDWLVMPSRYQRNSANFMARAEADANAA